MITPYLSQQPVDDFGLRFADLRYSTILQASTDTALTIPGNAQRYKALIKSGDVVWVSINEVAGLPGGSVFASTSSEMSNGSTVLCREVRAGDVLHFQSSTSAIPVSVVLYAVGTNN